MGDVATAASAAGSVSGLNPLERTVLELVLDAPEPLGPDAVLAHLSERRVIAEQTVLRAIEGLAGRGLLVRDGDALRATTTPQAIDQQERAVIAPTGGFRPGSSPVCEPWPPRPSKCC